MTEEEAAKVNARRLEEELKWRQGRVLKTVELEIYDIFEKRVDDLPGANERLHIHTPLAVNMMISGNEPGKFMKTNIAIMFCSGCHLVFFNRLPDSA